ncbi:Hypothetical protein RY67_1909 [Bifidobacterium longum subsp. infantis]|uniref:Uncharacterized protein n=1 Tax=Bifidobacterium longum subsp. infantis TaxID=1682 RepID=A0A0M4MI35_BIFLI|nr:Hypothetical protein RY67_1909 [Bifidobacterium longum subsp. infantis]
MLPSVYDVVVQFWRVLVVCVLLAFTVNIATLQTNALALKPKEC